MNTKTTRTRPCRIEYAQVFHCGDCGREIAIVSDGDRGQEVEPMLACPLQDCCGPLMEKHYARLEIY